MAWVWSAASASAPAALGGGPARPGAVLDCIVGGAESEAFLDQSRAMAVRWGDAGAKTRFEALPGLNHLTVLDSLFDAESGLVRRLAALARGR